MEARLIGTLNKAAALLIGTWDPLVPDYRALLQTLIGHARRHDQAAVAILLDPAPQIFLKGATNWPVYMGPEARLHWLLAEGLDGVLRVDFKEEDLRYGSYDILDLVRAHVHVAEIWMRPDQTLGRDAKGSQIAVAMYAKKHELVWRRVPTPSPKQYVSTVQKHLQNGELVRAQSMVGLPAIWSRPASNQLRFAWKAGTYQAIPLERLDAIGRDAPIELELRADADGLVSTVWPAGTEHIAFVSGPADQALAIDSLVPAAAAVA